MAILVNMLVVLLIGFLALVALVLAFSVWFYIYRTCAVAYPYTTEYIGSEKLGPYYMSLVHNMA